jgi:hypothetical protein
MILRWLEEYTNPPLWFILLSLLGWYVLSSFLGKADKDKYGLSVKVNDNFFFITIFVSAAIILGSDTEEALRDEWRQYFYIGDTTLPGLIAYVVAMFGALTIFNLLITYVYTFTSSGIKKIHQWINKL